MWVWLPDELEDDPVARRLGVGPVALYVALVAEAVRALADDDDQLVVPAAWTADFAGRPADRQVQRLIDCGWLQPLVEDNGVVEWLRVCGPVRTVFGDVGPGQPLRLLAGSG
jgi:hypothetical protein